MKSLTINVDGYNIGEGLDLLTNKPKRKPIVSRVVYQTGGDLVTAITTHAILCANGGVILDTALFTEKRNIKNVANYMPPDAVQTCLKNTVGSTYEQIVENAAHITANLYKDHFK